MRVFMTKGFARFCAQEGIDDSILAKAVEEIQAGLVHAELGHGLLKQRLAGRGKGKSGGYRTIVAHRAGSRLIFLHGFSKNRQATLSPGELDQYRNAARTILSLGDHQLDALVNDGTLINVGAPR